MKTVANISFDGDDVPGGAWAILRRARCGPDVAAVDDNEVLQRVFVDVTLEATDTRLPVLLDLLRRYEVRWLEIRNDHYTDEELASAPLVVMSSIWAKSIFGGPRLGTKYSLEGACCTCGARAKQTSALMIDGDDLDQLEGCPVHYTPYRDMFVDERVAKELEKLGAKGLSFRSVYAVMKDKRQVKLPYRQMCAARCLPPISPKSIGVYRTKPCSSCPWSGFDTKSEEPTRLVYRAQDLEELDDVHTTFEWYGDIKFSGDVSDSLLPSPFFLVSPRVMSVLRAAGDAPIRWRAVHAEEP